jgi:hypothetical protein
MDQVITSQRQIRAITVLYMIGLALSGITAFPLVRELNFMNDWVTQHLPRTALANWVTSVYNGVYITGQNFPFIAYGTDWLAFAHLIIALLFIGVLRNPVRNIWVIEWSILASLAVIPLAFIAGPIRSIPFFHQLIDCSFGVAGFSLGFILRKKILQLEKLTSPS